MGQETPLDHTALIARPSVGRIVHYHDGTAADPQPAIVTAVNGTHVVCLTVFAMDREPYNVGRVPASERPMPGAWCWPPRV
jgi:hypothetical protein